MNTFIRMGFNPDFFPFTHCRNGKPGGMLIDIINMVLTGGKYSIDKISCDMESHLLQLENGEIDAFLGIAVTDERNASLNFTQPLIRTGGAWFVLSEAGDICSAKKVVTPRSGPLTSIITRLYPHMKVLPSANYSEALELVVKGEVDAAALNYHVGKNMVLDRYPGKFVIPKEMFQELDLAVAFKDDAPGELLDFFNDRIEFLGENGSLKHIVDAY